VFREFDNYISYGFSERKNRKRKEELIANFNEKQRKRLAQGEVAFDISPIQFKQISETINRIMALRKQGEPGAKENIKTLGKLSNIISRLSGAEIQLEAKIRSLVKDELQSILKN